MFIKYYQGSPVNQIRIILGYTCISASSHKGIHPSCVLTLSILCLPSALFGFMQLVSVFLCIGLDLP